MMVSADQPNFWVGPESTQTTCFLKKECVVQPAPLACSRPIVPASGRELIVSRDPASTWAIIKRFLLGQEIPFQCEKLEPWSMQGVAFVDFVPVGLAIKIWDVRGDSTAGQDVDEYPIPCYAPAQKKSLVRGPTLVQIERLATCCDIVCFSEMFRKLATVLGTGRTDQDWQDDFSDISGLQDEEEASKHLDELLREAIFGRSTGRAEAWRAVARICHEEHQYHELLGRAIFEQYRSEIVEILNANSIPIAILYPVAAVVRLAATSSTRSRDAPTLFTSVQDLSNLPSLVASTLFDASELAGAKRNCRGHLCSAETSDDGSGGSRLSDDVIDGETDSECS